MEIEISECLRKIMNEKIKLFKQTHGKCGDAINFVDKVYIAKEAIEKQLNDKKI